MENGGYYIKIVTSEFILAVIVILSVVVIKYFFKDTYKEFKVWYAENVAVDTDVYEVLGDFNEI